MVDPAEFEFRVGVVRLDHLVAPLGPGLTILAKIQI
jgi:hypothetical protein